MTVITTLHSARLRVEVASLLHADPSQQRHEFGAYAANTPAPAATLLLRRRTVKRMDVTKEARHQGFDAELLALAESWIGKPLIFDPSAASPPASPPAQAENFATAV